jgi:molybdate transport system substrate-binding protein
MSNGIGKLRLGILAAAICGTIFASAVARADEITVAAANSLRDVLNDIGKQYQADTGQKVSFTFGASGTLEVKIQQGEPFDLFISAAAKQVDVLVAQRLADGDSRTIVATNALVLAVPKDQPNPPAKFEDLTDGRFQRIAIAKPKIFAAGDYAMQVLKWFHIDDAVADRLVIAPDAQEIAQMVSRGDVNAGLCFATDAAAEGNNVKIAAVAPEESHSAMVYPAVIIEHGHKADAEAFLQYLLGPKGKAEFTNRGFGLPATRPGS